MTRLRPVLDDIAVCLGFVPRRSAQAWERKCSTLRPWSSGYRHMMSLFVLRVPLPAIRLGRYAVLWDLLLFGPGAPAAEGLLIRNRERGGEENSPGRLVDGIARDDIQGQIGLRS